MKIPKTKRFNFYLLLFMVMFTMIITAFKNNEEAISVENSLLKDINPTPYSIVFMGIDNEIDSTGTDRITLMLVRELKSGESFSITNAIYHKVDRLHPEPSS